MKGVAMKKKKYVLSDDAEKEIRRLLHEYDPEKVNVFIWDVKQDFLIANRFQELEENERPKQAKKILSNLITTIGNLEYLKREFVFLGAFPDETPFTEYRFCRGYIEIAMRELIKLRAALETMITNRKMLPGHPEVDRDKVIYNILWRYESAIDRAHPYKGLFPKIIDAILEDKEKKSQIRAIRKAIKEYRTLQAELEANYQEKLKKAHIKKSNVIKPK